MRLFTPETFEFLVENRERNDKAWYSEHKTRFNDLVIEPFADLVRALTPAVSAVDPEINTEPKVDKTISRVYRDTRFSKDKSLYRDVMWLNFMRKNGLYEGLPAYFFELSPQKLRWGCGYYTASADSMAAIRSLILDGDALFYEADACITDEMRLEGDMYKRPKYPDAPENRRRWLERKSLCFIRRSADFKLLYSGGIADTLAEDFTKLAPAYRFFMKAETAADGLRAAKRQ